MVECDGLCAMDKAEAFAEAMGHILWEGRIRCEGDILWGQMGQISTFKMQSECIASG